MLLRFVKFQVKPINLDGI